MTEVTASQVLEAPADAVWSLLADFGAIQRWWPTDGSAPIERVTLEGEGVGMIRHIHNRGAAHAVSERLDFLDPSSRTIVLSIVGQRPAGITAYVAEGHVTELDAGAMPHRLPRARDHGSGAGRAGTQGAPQDVGTDVPWPGKLCPFGLIGSASRSAT